MGVTLVRRTIAALGMTLALVAGAAGQDALDPAEPSGLSPAAEKLKALADPDSALRKESEKRSRPPFEFFRTQVAPSEVIPLVKPNHWATMALEMRANHADYSGTLRTAPVRLLDMPHRVVFEREASLIGEQDARLTMQMFIPTLPSERNEIDLELIRPEAIRGDGVTQAILQRLQPHQMIVPVLGVEAPNYLAWARFQATLPTAVDRDPAAADRFRYYRPIAAQDPERSLPLPPHPLTWTAISHVIWDGQDPEGIGIGPQQAMIDWLHWGGQLIVVGGAGPSLAPLQDSFLAPYLPATPSGRDVLLDRDDLAPLSEEFPPPYWPIEGETGVIPRYDGRDPARRTIAGGPVFVSGLSPGPGATTLTLGDPDGTVLGVEWRVGRGRVLMLAFKPGDPALRDWPGLDTWARRVVFRRPVEPRGGRSFNVLPATEVSWLRYVARDLGAPADPGAPIGDPLLLSGELVPPATPVAAWLDSAAMPVQARQSLERASGITIPGSNFVLRVVLAYIAALVPLNWLICRYLLRRPEWAWAATPVLALGFAVAVERAAAYDLGFDSACDEIDLVEIQGEYPRAHVSRFAALYATGRVSYSIAYPDEPSALALPMSMGPERYQRGQDLAQSRWDSYPAPTLEAFPVQPRSVSMFRAEAMDDLPGGITLEDGPEGRMLVNRSGLELRDAVVVDAATGDRYALGTVGPAATAALGEPDFVEEAEEGPEADESAPSAATPPAGPGWLDLSPFLAKLRSYRFGRPEDREEWRLVAWTPDPHPGQVLTPAVDRHRGVRLVVAHLDYGPGPRHDDPSMIGDSPPGLAARPDPAGPRTLGR